MAKILLIEDEAPIRANLRRFLTLEGYQVVEASNGSEGLAAISVQHPDLILCDVMMPELDGFGLLGRLRSDPATAAIPFVFVTASAEKGDLERGRELGADEYVTKPFNLPELLALVKRRLGNR